MRTRRRAHLRCGLIAAAMAICLAKLSLAQQVRPRIEVLSPAEATTVEQWSGAVPLRVRVVGLPAGGPPPWVTANIRRPTGGIRHEALVDDGSPEYGDDMPKDGIYSGLYDRCDVAGDYRVELVKVSLGGREWSFPGRVGWTVVPADPVSAEVKAVGEAPWRVALEVRIKSRYWARIDVKVATESGLGRAEALSGSVTHYGEWSTRVVYDREALRRLRQMGKVRLVGWLPRRGLFADAVAVQWQLVPGERGSAKAESRCLFNLSRIQAFAVPLAALVVVIILLAVGNCLWRRHTLPWLTGCLSITTEDGNVHVVPLSEPRAKRKNFCICLPGGATVRCVAWTVRRYGAGRLVVRIGEDRHEVSLKQDAEWEVPEVGHVEYHWATKR